jgi:glutathione synthase/RimK-type ligase-like ATP-grasp enzyme
MNMRCYWVVCYKDFDEQTRKKIENKYHKMFQEASEKHGISFSFIDSEDLSITCDHKTNICLGNQNIATEDTAFLISNFSMDPKRKRYLDQLYYAFLESDSTLLNKTFYHGAHLEKNKFSMTQLITQLGIPNIPTHFMKPSGDLKHAELFYQNHCIDHGAMLKPNEMGMGIGISHCKSWQDTKDTWQRDGKDVDYILQPYIPHIGDLRLYLYNHSVVEGQFRIVPNGRHQANISQGAMSKDVEFPQALRTLAKNISRHVGAEQCCIDWLITEKSFFFNEITTTLGGFTGLKESKQKVLADRLFNYIQYRITSNKEKRNVWP